MEASPLDLIVSGENQNMAMLETRIRELKGRHKQLGEQVFTNEGAFNHAVSVEMEETFDELMRLYTQNEMTSLYYDTFNARYNDRREKNTSF